MALGYDITATRFNQRDFQIQRKNHFEIEFDNTFIDSNLKFFVSSITLPKETTESFKANFWNDSVSLAAKTNFETTPLVLKDAIGYDTEQKFLAWRLRVYNPKTGFAGYASDFKCDALVKEYSPNGDFLRAWRYVGVWPSAIEYGEMNYENGEEKTLAVTLTYDKAYREDLADLYNSINS